MKIRRKEDILRLRAEGKSYKQIIKILGCDPASVCYHCGVGQKHKSYLKCKFNKRKCHPYYKKLDSFNNNNKHGNFINIDSITKNYRNVLHNKLKRFNNVENSNNMVTLEQAIDKLSLNPRCYLTGREIDISKTRSYHFDHILPKSRGGDNSIDNLGIAVKAANMAKSDLTIEEFIQLCKDVLVNHGYDVKKL
jgi:hypothetical protein